MFHGMIFSQELYDDWEPTRKAVEKWRAAGCPSDAISFVVQPVEGEAAKQCKDWLEEAQDGP